MDLSEWLLKNMITRSQFAKMLGVSKFTVYSYLRGNGADFRNALKIEKITDGQIKAKDLVDKNARYKNCHPSTSNAMEKDGVQ